VKEEVVSVEPPAACVDFAVFLTGRASGEEIREEPKIADDSVGAKAAKVVIEGHSRIVGRQHVAAPVD
jgi:hypothetical protein